ncbi:MAG: helix-turn-helix transcriptional regulator [Spirochaetales bacterium]|nr:helix-turn-helix transcriptional regulator [Spirochaetales bacterium]
MMREYQNKTKEELITLLMNKDVIIDSITKNCKHIDIAGTAIKGDEILNQVINLNPFAIAIWNRRGYFVKCNKAYINMFLGHPPADYSIWDDPGLKSKKETWNLLMELRDGKIMRAPPMRYNSHDMNPDYPDNPICFKTTAFPVYSLEKEPDYFVFMYDDVTFETKIVDENLRQKKIIEESNITLRNLIYQLEKEKESIKENIALNIEKIIKPIISKIDSTSPNTQIILNSLQKHLDSLTESFYKRMINMKFDLSPAEIRICELIKNDYLSKEIGQILNISVATVQTHKKNIRKKLHLKGSKKNLKLFLLSL